MDKLIFDLTDRWQHNSLRSKKTVLDHLTECGLDAINDPNFLKEWKKGWVQPEAAVVYCIYKTHTHISNM